MRNWLALAKRLENAPGPAALRVCNLKFFRDRQLSVDEGRAFALSLRKQQECRKSRRVEHRFPLVIANRERARRGALDLTTLMV
jgi:hypothetical protein